MNYKNAQWIIILALLSLLFIINFQNCGQMNSSSSTDATPTPTPASSSSTTTDLTIVTNPVSQQVSLGQYVYLYVYATASASITYQWYKDGSLITDATTNYYLVSAVTSSHLGSYYVVVTDGTSTLTSSTATLSTSAITTSSGLSIVTNPVSQVVTIGEYVYLFVSASSTTSASLTYQWYKDGSALSGATSSYYAISSITSSSLGQYYVIVSDGSSSLTSSSATLSLTSTTTVTGVSLIFDVSLTSLQTKHSSCSSSDPLSIACRAAINRTCQGSGYMSGFGPVAINSDIWSITCVTSTAAQYIQTNVAELVSAQPLCAWSSGSSIYCLSGVNRACAARGFLTGWGYVENSSYLSDQTSQIDLICLNTSNTTLLQVTASALSAKVSTCIPSNGLTSSCMSAINQYCQSAGYVSGYGPVEINSVVTIACVN